MPYIVSARLSSVAYSDGIITMSQPLYVEALTDELINGYVKGYLAISPPPDLNNDGVADPTPEIAPNDGFVPSPAPTPGSTTNKISLFSALPDINAPTQTFQEKEQLFPSSHISGGQRF